MYLAVQQVCQQNPTDWQTVPATRTYSEFQQCIEHIQTGLRRQKLRMTGAATAKNQTRTALANKAFVVAQAVVAYAYDNRNPLLAQKVDHKISVWQRCRPNLVREYTEQLIQIATTLLPDMTDYITAGDVSALQMLLEEYTANLIAPRNAANHRREATQSLAATFQKTDGLLEMLDRLFLQHQDKPFYKVYRSARKVVRLRGGASAKVTVKEQVKEPVSVKEN